MRQPESDRESLRGTSMSFERARFMAWTRRAALVVAVAAAGERLAAGCGLGATVDAAVVGVGGLLEPGNSPHAHIAIAVAQVRVQRRTLSGYPR